MEEPRQVKTEMKPQSLCLRWMARVQRWARMQDTAAAPWNAGEPEGSQVRQVLAASWLCLLVQYIDRLGRGHPGRLGGHGDIASLAPWQ